MTVATLVTKQECQPIPGLSSDGLIPSRRRRQNARQKVEASMTVEQGQLPAGLKLSSTE